MKSHVRVSSSTVALIIILAFHVVSAFAENWQCNATMSFQDENNTMPFRGRKWRFHAEAAPNAEQTLVYVNVQNEHGLFMRQIYGGFGVNPVDGEHVFSCLPPGRYTTWIQAVCDHRIGGIQTFTPVQTAEFTVTPNQSSLSLQAELLSPASAVANVRISYSFPPNAGMLEVSVDGAQSGDPLYFVPQDYTGSVDVSLNAGTHTVQGMLELTPYRREPVRQGI